MADYSTTQRTLQEEFLTDSDGKILQRWLVDVDTGEVVTPLVDKRFAWRERKNQALKLADLYAVGQMDKQSDRAKACSTWLEYLADYDDKRQLHKFNACKQRLCPICAARKAHLMAGRLTRIMRTASRMHPGTQYIFLTLTVKNCAAQDLRATLDLLTKAWFKLYKRRPVERAVKGWFRAIEITYNRKSKTFHPHIHAILMVEDAYFDRKAGLYLDQAVWESMWQQCLRVNYKPRVDIRTTKAKDHGAAAEAAAVEAAKYATKSSDWLKPGMSRREAAGLVRTYTDALHRKRLTAIGGWLLEASQLLGLDGDGLDDGDLVHDEDGDGELTTRTAPWLENYGWHWGIGEHILTARLPNPEYVDQDDDTDGSEAGQGTGGDFAEQNTTQP